MAFLENDTANQERFSLLLLEPREIYFEDFSVFYFPAGLSQYEPTKKKQRGHMKICSNSILFDPKDTQYPILKFPMRTIQSMEELRGAVFPKNKSLEVVSDLVIEMREKNIIAPYRFRKGKSGHVFSLNYVTVEDCLPQMCQLHRASTLPLADQNAMINAIVLARQSRVKFDTSWLEDLYEKIILETSGDRVTPLVTNPGRIMLTSSRLYFQPFNNVDPMPVLKLRLSDIRRVVKRRFLLSHVGLEIYGDTNGPFSHLYLNMKTQALRDELFDRLLKQPGVKLEDIGQENMTMKWMNGVISNYDYILYLNSMADRSFNDLTQYPVMPWIIADYSSPSLDLTSASTFRDLTKPIGALNETRLQALKERYNEMPEPKFLYGSHYSTPGYVLFYLARVSPEYMLCLQNGRFDQPDRMFNSLSEVWYNCQSGQADFKELIPEFYSSSNADFFKNNRNINYGTKHNGKPVTDVELPPWATDPSDFTRKLREALECDYVSQHLHYWIDLVFGYKQNGIEAERADNVFYYLTYEGAVQLDSIADMNERAGLEVQIMEFGQIPKQLFACPHPRRFSSIPQSLQLSAPDDNNIITVESEHNTPDKDGDFIADISPNHRTIHNMKSLKLHLQHTLHKEAVSDVKLSPDSRSIFSVSYDSLLKMYSLEDQRQLRSINLSNMALSCCSIMPDNKTVIVGSWDNQIYLYSIEYGRVLDAIVAHDDAVSSIHWQSGLLLTASWDATVKVWQYDNQSKHASTAEIITELDHDCRVMCMSVSPDNSLMVTGTDDGSIHVWDLSNYTPTAQYHRHEGNVNAVLLTDDCRQAVSCGADQCLKVSDLDTGTEVFSKDPGQELRCMCLTNGVLVTGGNHGDVLIWDLSAAVLIHTFKAHDEAVMCVHAADSGILVTGGQDKKVILWKPS